MKFFLFDNSDNSVIVNEPEILLVREFSALWSNDRNKTKADPKGIKKNVNCVADVVNDSN